MEHTYRAHLDVIAKALIEKFSNVEPLLAANNRDTPRNSGMLAARLFKRARRLTGEKPSCAPRAVEFLLHVIRSGKIAFPTPNKPRNCNDVMQYWQTWLTGSSRKEKCSLLELLYREWLLEQRLAAEQQIALETAQEMSKLIFGQQGDIFVREPVSVQAPQRPSR